MDNVYMTQLAVLTLHALRALTAITFLAVLLVNVFNAPKSKVVFHVKILTQHNACSAKMATMLKPMVVAINVLKDVHYVQVPFSVH